MPTLAFWKPYGVLSKFTDRAEPPRPTLGDYVPFDQVYGAGRLDLDSEGLLVLSDDPALRGHLTHPRAHVARTYVVQVEGRPDPEAIARLCDGVVIGKQRTRRAYAEVLDDAPDLPERPVPIRVRPSIPTSWVALTLTEGRNRQVRRMTAAVGFPTLRLVRVAIGTVTLDGLEPGGWRHLSPAEIDSLWRRKG